MLDVDDVRTCSWLISYGVFGGQIPGGELGPYVQPEDGLLSDTAGGGGASAPSRRRGGATAPASAACSDAAATSSTTTIIITAAAGFIFISNSGLINLRRRSVLS